MEIREVRIHLPEVGNDKVVAFANASDGEFVIHDIRVIRQKDRYFVAMPSRKLMDRCFECGTKNHLRSRYCNYCGVEQDENRANQEQLHTDVFHPINAEGRAKIERAVIEAYLNALKQQDNVYTHCLAEAG